MKTANKFAAIIFLVIAFISCSNLNAQRKGSQGNGKMQTHQSSGNKRVSVKHHSNDRYRTQPIRRNPHYRYPRHRRVVGSLHHHHVRMFYRGLPYYYYAGLYYTAYGDDYVIVLPPRGFRITVLPVGNVRLVVGPSVYFYHSGVYYVERTVSDDREERYEVTQAPVGGVVEDLPDDVEEVVIDGKIFYDHNEVLYKKVFLNDGKVSYEVIYIKTTGSEEN
ncbi:MAG: hypothetical protein ACI828_001043 [Flavobacteriales bacterium]|jgi:hypothetical protein